MLETVRRGRSAAARLAHSAPVGEAIGVIGRRPQKSTAPRFAANYVSPRPNVRDIDPDASMGTDRAFEEVWDLRALQSSNYAERGIGRFVQEQALAHSRLHPQVAVQHLINDNLPVPPAVRRLASQLDLVSQSQQFSPPTSTDLWYLTSPFDDLVAYPPAFRSKWFVTTCYDLIPLRTPDQYLGDKAVRKRYESQVSLLTKSDLILCISQATADDVTALLGIGGERLRVIGAGCSDRFSPFPDLRLTPNG